MGRKRKPRKVRKRSGWTTLRKLRKGRKRQPTKMRKQSRGTLRK